jgi:hypothetical protein
MSQLDDDIEDHNIDTYARRMVRESYSLSRTSQLMKNGTSEHLASKIARFESSRGLVDNFGNHPEDEKVDVDLETQTLNNTFQIVGVGRNIHRVVVDLRRRYKQSDVIDHLIKKGYDILEIDGSVNINKMLNSALKEGYDFDIDSESFETSNFTFY